MRENYSPYPQALNFNFYFDPNQYYQEDQCLEYYEECYEEPCECSYQECCEEPYPIYYYDYPWEYVYPNYAYCCPEPCYC